MKPEQTRQLGIEFERRIQAMVPSEEFSNKLDTDTIYAYLNEYQTQYINSLYTALDLIPSDTKAAAQAERLLQPLISSKEFKKSDLVEDQNPFSYQWELPTNFQKYISGFVEDNEAKPLFVKYMKFTDVIKTLNGINDKFRIIRNPFAVISKPYDPAIASKNTITVYCDSHTNITVFRLYYYHKPVTFDVKDTACELSMDSFEDLVNGAVQLYISHATAANKKEQPKNKEEQ